VEVGGLELLHEFYRVFAINMRDLGSPVHARGFFRAILECFGEVARVVLVKRDGVPLGGLISIAFKDTLYVPWASSLREYATLCPNMLLYWETLRRGCKDGFARFDFGRSTRGSGTYRFKRQWGAAETQLYWYIIPLAGRRYTKISGNDDTGVLMQRLWSRLPLGVTRMLGPRIRRYLTQ
jgi:lipid II:glycine glycyltransferase (peptidoglycan interpeptide bridge formation enzyme)